eukprot:gene26292-47564_t
MDSFSWWCHQQGDDRWTSVDLHWWESDHEVEADRPLDGQPRQRGIERTQGLDLLERIIAEWAQPQVLVAPLGALTSNASAPSAGEARLPATPKMEPVPTRPGFNERDVMEDLVASTWQEVLGVPGLRRDESFLDLGGDSLAATRVAARLREGLDLHVPLRLVLKAASITQLSEALNELVGSRDKAE